MVNESWIGVRAGLSQLHGPFATESRSASTRPALAQSARRVRTAPARGERRSHNRSRHRASVVQKRTRRPQLRWIEHAPAAGGSGVSDPPPSDRGAVVDVRHACSARVIGIVGCPRSGSPARRSERAGTRSRVTAAATSNASPHARAASDSRRKPVDWRRCGAASKRVARGTHGRTYVPPLGRWHGASGSHDRQRCQFRVRAPGRALPAAKARRALASPPRSQPEWGTPELDPSIAPEDATPALEARMTASARVVADRVEHLARGARIRRPEASTRTASLMDDPAPLTRRRPR